MHDTQRGTTRFLELAALLSLCLGTSLSACQAESLGGDNPQLFAKENLVAWCVVPFDNQKRTPAERTQMLKELGIRSLAWDWRDEHLDWLEEESALLQEAGIELHAVWCWVRRESDGELSDASDRILAILEKIGAKTDIWLSFSASSFAGLTDEQKVERGAKRVALIREKANAIGCRVCLYNHGGWFGDPRNMVRIIQRLNADDIGLVYNFHHAHEQVAEFQANLALMMPYLSTVNLNGMRVEGPEILPLGAGDLELSMLQQLKASGFNGRIGVLGHVEEADVKEVLTNNLAGLVTLLRQMGETEALSTYGAAE